MKTALGVLLKGLMWGLAALFVVSLLICFGAEWLVQVPVLLAVGWVGFLAHVLPEVTFRWGAIAETVAVGAVLGVGSHLFLRRLWREWQAGKEEARPWPARWSVSLLAFIVLLFCATMATVGIGHHVGWLASGRAPVVESSWRFLREMREPSELCERALMLSKSGVKAEQVARALLSGEGTWDRAERLYVIPWHEPGGEVAFLVFPRDPAVRERSGGLRCRSGREQDEPVAAAELSRFLSEGQVAAGTPP